MEAVGGSFGRDCQQVACAIELVNDLFDGESDDVLMPGLTHTEFDMAYATHTQGASIPRSYEQILSLPLAERDRWFQACYSESDSHLSVPSISGKLTLAEFTKAAPIRLSWVFDVKSTGEYKARIVMQGQHMKEGIHFNGTHAPVPSPTVVRLFFALTAAGGPLHSGGCENSFPYCSFGH